MEMSQVAMWLGRAWNDLEPSVQGRLEAVTSITELLLPPPGTLGQSRPSPAEDWGMS